MPEMDEGEALWAKEFYDAIQAHAIGTDRSMQAAAFKVGVSDLGFCSERLRRTLLRIEPEHTDYLKAWIGTALGDHAEQAILAKFPDMIRQAEVRLKLVFGEREYNIPGHPDLIDPIHGILWDAKTDFGLSTIRRTGPSDQQQFQRHGYAKAAHAAGYFPNHTLDEIQVGNFWIDRGGVDEELHVQIEPYSEEWVTRAAEWLDEVIYAYRETAAGRPHEARKEPPREMCEVVCGHWKDCRFGDTDVEGLLTDPTVVAAVELYGEGLKLARAGARFKDEGKAHLKGISGVTKDYVLRWVWINETEDRRGYYKIDVKERKDKPAPQEITIDSNVS